MPELLPPIVEAFAGGVAAATASACVYPLDLVTSRIQTSSAQRKTRNPVEAIQRVIRDEGLLSLWAGVGSDALNTLLGNFLFFGCNVFLRQQIAQRRHLPPGKAPRLTAVEEILLGSLSGIISKGLTMPLSAIVVRMQTSSEDNEEQTGPTVVKDHASVAQVANDIYQEKGLSGFWSGFRATAVLTLNPSLNLYFGELLKRVLLPRTRREHPPAAVIFLISAFASAISSMATYPLILAKTRLQWKSPSGQQRYTSTRQVLRAAYAQKQLGGLYVGLESHLAKKVVEHGTTMALKERVEQLIILAYRQWKSQRV